MKVPSWMLHHDNAPCHMAISVIEFLAKKGIPVVSQPHTPLISVRATFFCSQNYSFTLKGAILGRCKTSKKL